MELLHKFWGVRLRAALREVRARVRTLTRGDGQALESPVTNFTQTPMRLILEWHAEAHLLPPWERALEARAENTRPRCLLCTHRGPLRQVVSWLRYAASKRGCPVMLVTLLRQPVDLYARCGCELRSVRLARSAAASAAAGTSTRGCASRAARGCWPGWQITQTCRWARQAVL